MFGIGQNFRSKQGYDMIRYDFPRFILEVGVVDAEVGVEPSHFVGDEFAWDKPLELSGSVTVAYLSSKRYKRDKNLGGNIVFDEGALFFLAFEDWCSVTRKVLNTIRIVDLSREQVRHSRCRRFWCRRHKKIVIGSCSSRREIGTMGGENILSAFILICNGF